MLLFASPSQRVQYFWVTNQKSPALTVFDLSLRGSSGPLKMECMPSAVFCALTALS